jgi:hypothetical protein
MAARGREKLRKLMERRVEKLELLAPNDGIAW